MKIRGNDAAYGIELAAPGLDKKDFKIDLDHDTLSISVEKSNESESKDEGYTRREFSYESFKNPSHCPIL